MIIVKTNLIFINNLQQCLARSNCLTKMSYCYFIVKMLHILCNLLMGRLLLVFPNCKDYGIQVLYLYTYICKYYQDKSLKVEVLGYRNCTLCQLCIYCLSAKPHPPNTFFPLNLGQEFVNSLSQNFQLTSFQFPRGYCHINLQNGCITLNSQQQCIKVSLCLITKFSK